MSGGHGTEETEPRSGVQVVKLGEGERRYELNGEALRRLLLSPDVRDLPVVVVSVAGAFRGGKSFILDFFLRYLNAPRSSQLSGEWLGNEDDQLEGFHWRGGSDRDTTGIVLWSQPFITTLETTGEKVAVLLMDTQGTFDSETTIAQNSTIFALSTLISSVQVYNLSGNIKEDDLQHLQLFTEYGKLADGTDGKAFQMLMFLVRDWASAHEYAYGFDGGDLLLKKRLQSNQNQKAELRDVREHIRSCFDQIKCFLMPHPGLTVIRPTFTGCIRDLTEEFRKALLMMVPSLFDPKHLTPKLINGERVRTQELFDYFQKYVDIFNSDDVPEPVTIFKATADACLLAAMHSARELYAARMEARVRDAVSVTSSTLSAWHHAARSDAERYYCGKRKLGAQADADAQLSELIKELDARLPLYASRNDAKVRDTMSLAKKAYENVLSNVCENFPRLCLHPVDLEELHAEACQAALALFDSAREVSEYEEDDQRQPLEQSLEQQYEHLCAINAQNNKSAVLEARDVYVTRMKLEMDHTGISFDRLHAQHQVALNEATAFLINQRNRSVQRENDPYIQQLLGKINSSFEKFEKTNENGNKTVMQAAENMYNNYITSAWGPQMCCFHPQALEDLHKKCMDEVFNVFFAERPDDDEFKAEVVKILEIRYSELQAINEYNNEQAVDHALLLYTTMMNNRARPTSILFFWVTTEVWQPMHHAECKEAALQDFKNKRRGAEYDDDRYFEDLKQKLQKIYSSNGKFEFKRSKK